MITGKRLGDLKSLNFLLKKYLIIKIMINAPKVSINTSVTKPVLPGV